MGKFKVNDRVRRLPYTITIPKDGSASLDSVDGEVETTTFSTRGCIGTVKAVREETTLAQHESRARSLMVQVLWDTGTLSYHGPEALELAR